ncbi:MAG: aminopeptidase P family protein, partial [Rhodospirillaceae bacterium]|nr:aminopeptidase P family protein [Rhodospirillaceae bacterium]
AEFDARYEKARARMAEDGLDALLVTSEPNYRYFTGHRSQFWVGNARPFLALIFADRAPLAIAASSEAATFENTSWIEDYRPYVGFADAAVDLLVEAIRENGLEAGRIGVDYGEEMRLGMPLTNFEALKAALPKVAFVDGAPTLWALRLFKSPAETAYKRKAMEIACEAFDRCWQETRAGMSEIEIQRRMHVAMIELGAHHVGWLPCTSGRGDFRFSQEPTERKVETGDIVWIDAGCTYHGYWSDVNRVAAVDEANEVQRETYRKNHELTQRMVAAIRPGLPVSEIVEVWKTVATELGIPEDFARFGRLGHGSGIQMLEPPSVWDKDDTELEPGMIIHLEPKTFNEYGCYQVEEVVVVTGNGSDYLTREAPAELPVTSGS